jgi:hypothetical protein
MDDNWTLVTNHKKIKRQEKIRLQQEKELAFREHLALKEARHQQEFLEQIKREQDAYLQTEEGKAKAEYWNDMHQKWEAERQALIEHNKILARMTLNEVTIQSYTELHFLPREREKNYTSLPRSLGLYCMNFIQTL